MRQLVVFNNVTLDSYFADRHGDMSWAHKDDAEWTALGAENARGGGVLLLGRITHELMANYWPTPAAQRQADAEVDKDAGLRQWECRAVVRAEGVKPMTTLYEPGWYPPRSTRIRYRLFRAVMNNVCLSAPRPNFTFVGGSGVGI